MFKCDIFNCSLNPNFFLCKQCNGSYCDTHLNKDTRICKNCFHFDQFVISLLIPKVLMIIIIAWMFYSAIMSLIFVKFSSFSILNIIYTVILANLMFLGVYFIGRIILKRELNRWNNIPFLRLKEIDNSTEYVLKKTEETKYLTVFYYT